MSEENPEVQEHSQHQQRQLDEDLGKQTAPRPSQTGLLSIVRNKDSTLTVFSLVVILLNIFLIGMVTMPDVKQTVLPNGDKVVSCGEYCFQVEDYHGVPIYRSSKYARTLSMQPCRAHRETGCIGEYVFSQDDKLYWSQQLHEVNGTKSLVVSATDRDGKTVPEAFKMRYMLQPPYNWILSRADVPEDTAPQSAIHIDDSS